MEHSNNSISIAEVKGQEDLMEHVAVSENVQNPQKAEEKQLDRQLVMSLDLKLIPWVRLSLQITALKMLQHERKPERRHQSYTQTPLIFFSFVYCIWLHFSIVPTLVMQRSRVCKHL